MKVVNSIVRQILIDTGSSIDIITWDCLKKLAYPGRDIVPLVHPILGFGGQEVNPIGMIPLLVRFGSKLRSKSLEVDFLVVDMPTANNVILERPTLHRGVGGLVPRVLTLGRRRNKLHLFRITTLIYSPLTLVHIVECFPTPLVQSDKPLQSWAFHRSPYPQAKTSTMAISSSRTLGGSEAPGVTKSQDLTKSWTSESLAMGSALMKLVDGCWVMGEELPAAW
ncbi:hypothetical protein Cgig2_022557 [Carnegiea gigantea]|uniref:Peptidase A2 domain-containing protein n=1 Tax=Carnegiea gigantea TaxID=171969 RepID=A0A9Q1KLX9_9CARY|nr:hypothetical protein Cgig2_022557 [Carnegiea gigantea]